MNFVTPSGFRDVLADEAVVRERLTRAVQDLFADRGYAPIETPTLEVMDVMSAGGRGCPSPFKFFDSQGDLLAMRPDVTLQIARMCATRLGEQAADPLRLRYTQRVFREADSDTQVTAREMTQIGIECIGEVGADVDAEVVRLLADALLTCCVQNFSLSIATVGVLRMLLDRSGGADAWKDAVLDAYHASDFVELDRITAPPKEASDDDAADADADATDADPDPDAVAADPAFMLAVRKLARIRGGREAIEEARALVEPLGCADGLDDLERTYDYLSEQGLEERLLVDFSVMSSFDYYTGIVFEAYSPYLGTPLGSGGRYDHMIAAYGSERPAAGFAFSLEQVMSAATADRQAALDAGRGTEDTDDAEDVEDAEDADGAGKAVEADDADNAAALAIAKDAAEDSDAEDGEDSDDAANTDAADKGAGSPLPSQPSASCTRPLRIAVPKGSLNPDAISCLKAAGLDVTGLDDPGRQLIIANPGIEFVIVRPSDAPAFVALGAADCGICGKDSLLEADAGVVELVDLKFGRCRFIVAEPEGARAQIDEHYRKLGSIRVATKYPRITADHYRKTGVQVEIVRLHGNIELAPLTGMAERIVDITATGTTLRENNLRIVEEVLSSTARFFANTCAFRTDGRIVELATALQRTAETADYAPIAGAPMTSGNNES